MTAETKLLRRDTRRRDRDRALLRLAMQRAGAAEHALRADIGERHRAQIEMDLIAELFPEIMRQAACLVAAAAGRRAGRAARRADRLVDREDDVGDARAIGAARQEIAAARPAHALDEITGAQLGEKLLEIRERDFLPLGDLGKRDRLAAAMLGEIDHRHHGVASFGAESHSLTLLRAGSKAAGTEEASRSSSSAASRARSRATSPCKTLNWQATGSGVSSHG